MSVSVIVLGHFRPPAGVVAIDKSVVHVKGQGSNVKVTEAKANFAPVWAFPEYNSSWNSQMATK